MSASMFWYDFETTGIDASADRALQVAGIRTDEALNEVGEPLNMYCRMADDILPHPKACLVTGISPSTLQQHGLSEAVFFGRLQQAMLQPQTCTAGYNSLRFDDEFTRYGLYRNFHDPYAREWQGGNSRWDILDALRSAWALAPDGIQWPHNEEGRVSFRLELLTAANGIEHGQAHDALADVRATIAMARVLRNAQPALYQHLYALRDKNRVHQALRIGRPVVHVSGKQARHRRYLSVVMPLLQDSQNKNAYVVCDLLEDVQPLLELTAEQIRQRLYTQRDQLPAGTAHIALKKVHANKCPALFGMDSLDAARQPWLEVDDALWRRNGRLLLDHLTQVQDKLRHVFSNEQFADKGDPEQQLYGGFLGSRDRDLCRAVLQADPQALREQPWPFDDPRLPQLLIRYRARNYPDSLTTEEQLHWQTFCKQRLLGSEPGAPLTLAGFAEAVAQLTQQERATAVIQEWQQYVDNLRQRYGV
ncbi:MAG: exodeoxyribonuclease I [Thiopseudomonas sp.]|nr:exodeoxyribonuclease I [Thiopseudomonas sp.]